MMLNAPHLASLQFRLTASIGAAVALLVLAVGSYWLAREERVLTATLQSHADTLSQLTARGLTEPIWNLDQPAIGNLLDALMTDPEVQVVELSADGVVWGEVARRVEEFVTWEAAFPRRPARYVRIRALRATILHLGSVAIR